DGRVWTMLMGRLAVLALSAIAGVAAAQSTPPEGESTGERVGRIASEPARDVGLQRTRIPPILERAAVDPYSLTGMRACGQIAIEVDALSRVLGPDFDAGPSPRRGSRAGQIAEAGGRAVVNSIIPFRGVVRELSGSAEADRRLQAATDAGIARRGFLRGVQRTRGCRN
ncbi:MAG: hypothetical protein AB7O91_04510, partial [Sphingomonas sp.]